MLSGIRRSAGVLKEWDSQLLYARETRRMAGDALAGQAGVAGELPAESRPERRSQLAHFTQKISSATDFILD